MQQHPDNSYDKSKMQSKNGILQFQFGEYPAIGILHFEERRDERTRINKTDIFGKTQLNDEDVLKKAFDILYKAKYKYIIDTIAENKQKGLKTEWVVAFQTDEIADDGRSPHYMFIVFSIDKKETAMNGIKQGEEALICVTIVKDTKKLKRQLPSKTVESNLCYYYDENDATYKWRNFIQR